ncbi:hypothetical protein ACIOZM_12975 [Pseudomonas sp. NPDC087346]|uniref:hypothetical protein n=1 Tax=Pseudomonas sp. NPDC087346 TaxID=3364438 RepID=UPI00381BEC98
MADEHESPDTLGKPEKPEQDSALSTEDLTARPTPVFVYPQDTGYGLVSPVYFQILVGENGAHTYELDDQYGGQRYTGYTNSGGTLFRSEPASIRGGRGSFGFRASVRGEWQKWVFVYFDIGLKPTITSFSPGAQLGARPIISGTKDARQSFRVQVGVDRGSAMPVTEPSLGQWRFQPAADLTPGPHTFFVEYYVPWGGQDRGRTEYPFTVFYSSALITQPKKDDVIREPRPEVSGTGPNNGVKVTIYREGAAGGSYGEATVIGGLWKVRLTKDLPQGPFVFHAASSFNDMHIGYSNKVAVTVDLKPVAPTITSPEASSLQAVTFTVSGVNGEVGAQVVLFHDLSDVQIGQSDVLTGAQWSISVTLPPGLASLVAIQIKEGFKSERSLPRLFKVRPPALTRVSSTFPTITSAVFSGPGFNGAIVESTIVKGPAGATVPPAALVAGGSWTTTSQNFPIGQYDLKFVQKVSDNAGGWIPSLEYLFGILTRLPPPSQVAYSVSNFTPSFSGQGNVGAQVHILESNSPVAPPVQVTTAGWLTAASSPWVPGSTRTVRVVQRLGDAESEAVELVVNIEAVPVPFNVKYTVQNYTPTFSGDGATGARLVIYFDGGSESAAPETTVVNGQWSSAAHNTWGPTHQRNIHIRQILNGVESQWVTITVDIPPEAPVISPIEGDGQPLVFKGTCLANAALSLRFSDSATEHKPDGRTGNWTFQRSTDFALDQVHTATLIQTIAQQDSPPALREFSVYPNKLIITEPAENAEVARDIVVRGDNGQIGASVQLYDDQFGTPLGAEKQLTAEGRWEVAPENLEFRKYQISARQKIAGKESPRSEERNFFVVLKPPLIDIPQEDQPLPRTFPISGAGMPFGQVTIWSQGESAPLLEKIPVNGSGEWKAELTLPVGRYIFKARQFFQTQESKDSPLRSFKVVPAAPIIESPGKGSHVGQSFVASGFGVFGDLITLALNGSKRLVLGSTPVLEDRSWSLTLTLDAPPGICNLVAIASCDGFESSESTVHPVVRGTYLPGFGKPAIGQWVQSPISFAGNGRPGVGRITSWYDPDVLLSTNIPVPPQGWQSAAEQPLRDGGHWCRFQQTIVDDADGATLSDWIESGRFEKSSTPPD